MFYNSWPHFPSVSQVCSYLLFNYPPCPSVLGETQPFLLDTRREGDKIKTWIQKRHRKRWRESQAVETSGSRVEGGCTASLSPPCSLLLGLLASSASISSMTLHIYIHHTLQQMYVPGAPPVHVNGVPTSQCLLYHLWVSSRIENTAEPVYCEYKEKGGVRRRFTNSLGVVLSTLNPAWKAEAEGFLWLWGQSNLSTEGVPGWPELT